MEVKLNCGTFVRLAAIALTPRAKTEKLDVIYIERKAGLTVAIAANRNVAAIERIEAGGNDAEGAFCLSIDPALLNQCKTEIAFASNLEIVANVMLGFISVKTTMGFIAPGNGGHFKPSHFASWREWLPPKDVQASKGGIFCAASSAVDLLLNSSPSGQIVFPEIIDTKKPLIVRDFLDENWLGLFMPIAKNDQGDQIECPGAIVPAWVK
jgi:hypothetical protein